MLTLTVGQITRLDIGNCLLKIDIEGLEAENAVRGDGHLLTVEIEAIGQAGGDLKQDLEEGYVRDIEIPLDGFEVIALNVTKLRSDNVDPREYLDRLESWKGRVESTGGTWRVINDLDSLDGLL